MCVCIDGWCMTERNVTTCRPSECHLNSNQVQVSQLSFWQQVRPDPHCSTTWPFTRTNVWFTCICEAVVRTTCRGQRWRRPLSSDRHPGAISGDQGLRLTPLDNQRVPEKLHSSGVMASSTFVMNVQNTRVQCVEARELLVQMAVTTLALKDRVVCFTETNVQTSHTVCELCCSTMWSHSIQLAPSYNRRILKRKSSYLVTRLLSVCTFHPQQPDDQSQERGFGTGHFGWLWSPAFKDWLVRFCLAAAHKPEPRADILSSRLLDSWMLFFFFFND